MPDFQAIRFQPQRPLLRELTAERLNLILQEIKRNKPLPGRGIAVRQTGQGTAIDLAAALKGGPAAPMQPWDLIVRVDPNADSESESRLVTVRPGTLNGFLPENWEEEFNIGNGLYYAKALVETDGRAQTSLTIAIDETPPAAQDPQEFALPSSIELLFGLVIEGAAYRTIGANFIATPKLWLTTPAETPPQPGELPFRQYFYFA